MRNMVWFLPACLAQMSFRTFAVFLSHYRSLITTTNECYISFTTCPDFISGFPESLLPLSILQSGVEFTCSPDNRGRLWNGLYSVSRERDKLCQLYPGCDVASIFRTPATLITGTTVTTCFLNRNLLYRDFIVGSFFPNKTRDRLFSSKVHTYRNHCSRFSLTVRHTGVSARCSVFNGWSPDASGPSEGLSIGCPIVLHLFQSNQPQRADSSHARFGPWSSCGFRDIKLSTQHKSWC